MPGQELKISRCVQERCGGVAVVAAFRVAGVDISNLVSQAGGTVTALSLAEQVNIEKTAAGNRLVTLQKKGYLQRVEQPHPAGDLFVDPRSVHLTSQKDDR